jgi:hypothetical protein
MKLDEIQKLCDGATPGPWKPGHTYDHQRNAAFIAASRTLIPKLLAVAKAAQDYRDGSYDVSFMRLWDALDALEAE